MLHKSIKIKKLLKTQFVILLTSFSGIIAKGFLFKSSLISYLKLIKLLIIFWKLSLPPIAPHSFKPPFSFCQRG